MLSDNFSKKIKESVLNDTRRAEKDLSCLMERKKNPKVGFVICNIRDSRHFLPHFLRHYRSIGVKKFIFVDNSSNDGSKEYLLDQEDCDVFESTGDYKLSNSGIFWKNVIIARNRDAKWVLSVDIDELAIYDGWPDLTIDEFAIDCARAGLSAVTAVMLDMYSADPLLKAKTTKDSTDLINDFPFYDGTGYTKITYHDWRRNEFPRQIIEGGPSKRISGGKNANWLAKTPFLLKENIHFLDPHTVIPIDFNFSQPLIALLHFRFTGELSEKLKKVKRQGYSDGSIKIYNIFGSHIENSQSFSLKYEFSERFTMPKQLVDKGLLASLQTKENSSESIEVKESPSINLFNGNGTLFEKLLPTVKNFFEYGCGKSTEFVCKYTNANIYSVDTDKFFIDQIEKLRSIKRQGTLNLKWIDVGNVNKWGFPTSYTKRMNFKKYAEWPWTLGICPDLVLIDGRFRICCFLVTLKNAPIGTKILFNDYNHRPHYHIAEEFLKVLDRNEQMAYFKTTQNGKSMVTEEIISNFKYVID